MSDPVPSSSAPHAQSSFSSDSSNGTYAFIVHSQNTLPQNLPPNVDNKALARQKRRRTSAEDQARLEAYFAANHKPDKAARLEIVKQVSLGEKEVQIWFQNRRQTTRRKNKPLTYETIPSLQSSFSSVNTDDLRSSQPSSEENSSQEPMTVMTQLGNHQNSSFTLLESQDSISSSQASMVDASHSQPLQAARPNGCAAALPEISFEAPKSYIQSHVFPPVLPRPTASKPGYLSNRRLTQTTSQDSPALSALPNIKKFAKPDVSKPEPPALFLKESSSSNVRLSLSLEGKAQVITGDDVSPPRRRPLQRSQSAVAVGGCITDSIFSMPRTTSSGRSRDSRTWEFYCDSEARDALSANAQREQNGNAAGAIGLIRSRSTNALHPSTTKRNAETIDAKPAKRVKLGGREDKPKLQRASSSLARLQTSSADSLKPKKLKSSLSKIRKVHDDSDKENWIPGSQQAPPSRRRHLPKDQFDRQSQNILKENQHIPSNSGSFGAAIDGAVTTPRRSGKSGIVKIFEDSGAQALDPRGSSHTTASCMTGQEEEDIECVNTLLSLSQGYM